MSDDFPTQYDDTTLKGEFKPVSQMVLPVNAIHVLMSGPNQMGPGMLKKETAAEKNQPAVTP